MKFKNLKIGQKLIVGFGIILLAAIGFAAYTIVSMNTLKRLQDEGHKRAVDALLTQNLRSTGYRMYQIIADAQLNGYTSESEIDWENHKTETLDLMVKAAAVADHTDEKIAAEEAQKLIGSVVTIFEDKMAPLLKSNPEASEINTYDAEIDAVMDKFQEQVEFLVISLGEEMDNGDAVFDKDANQIKSIAYLLSGLLILLSILIIILMNNLLAKPLVRGVKYTQKVAEGDLTAEIDINQKDEVGQLVIAIKKMAASLKEIVAQIIASSAQIASSSEQLSSTSEEVSQGANEQASSVEEVSSTMEEMVSNIEQNTQNAALTEKISTNAANGVKKVSEAAIKSLNSVKEISGKISIINDIAFQTNILALNAAVEAARAGEHGRGFAVVAAEVRKLAERSKVAADEIVTLSIESVNVTEGAGKLMGEIIPDIEKTAQLVKEIAAASAEQNNGANQVNNALQQLNSVVQQNASSSEEMASSAEELTSQAEMLTELVKFFKIGNEYQRSSHFSSSSKVNSPKKYVQEEKTSKPKAGVNLRLANHSNNDAGFESF
jgi:methyl-accepting chemotaxis protein